MFDNNTDIFLFKYEVQLDNVITAICDISFDIGKQIEEIQNHSKGFTIVDLFQDLFVLDMSIRPEDLSDKILEGGAVDKGYTNDEYFSYISDYFNKNLFYNTRFLDGLKGSDILLINKKRNYYLRVGKKTKPRLIPALINAKILKELISKLKSDKIRNSLDKIEMFENDIFYQKTVNSSEQEGQPLLPLLNITFFNSEMIETNEIDIDDFWINFQYYKKYYNVDLSNSQEYFQVLDFQNKKEIGLLVNDSIILYANIDLINYISKDKILDYYWLLFQHTYFIHKPNIGAAKINDSVNEFKSLNNDIELNQLLSFLNNNFYISDGNLIKEKFSKFFNSVVTFDKLKFLEEYQFLMSSNIDEETALGIYSNEKKESSYNLLHWLNHKGPSKVDHFRNSSPTEIEKKLIYTLKPSISYYYLEKYFEDFFESILVTNQYDFFANKTLNEKGLPLCEIDFFIKTKTKFYFIETKTKLSRFYIDEFLKTSSIMIDRFNPMNESDVEIVFILLGCYSDDNVKDFQYFIDASADKMDGNYNIARENLNCKPYYFTVPIPDKKGKKIICIAEPQYDKLQKLVLQICPK